MTKELTCINCPLGCTITAVCKENGEIETLSGYTCKRGEEYAKHELTHPTRTVTSTIRVQAGKGRTVPVKTAQAIPKEKIFTCMEQIKAISVQAPVKAGEVILTNVAQTGIDVVATGSVERA